MLRIRRLGVAVAVLAATVVVLAPATAAADDQSVYDAWHTAHPRFVKLRHDFDKAERHWENSGYKDPDPAYKAARRTVALAKKVTAALQRDVTSTAAGSKARSVALKGLNHRRKWADAERRAIVAFMRFDGDGYLRLHDDAKTYIHRAQKFEKQAGKLFKEAGVKLGA